MAYLGEGGYINPWFGFVVGMCGWGYILQEIFSGEAGQCDPQNEYVKESFNTMRLIVTAGWSIYPLGYFFGYLLAAMNQDIALNSIYNLADFVNKIGFCLAIWSCAKSSSLTDRERAVSMIEEADAMKAQANAILGTA